jgi:23S rRNA (adenine2503-C2)-methyltransferase
VIPLLEQTPAELRDWFVQHGLPGYRASQVRKWLFQKRAATFDEMTDLPVEVRKQLTDQFQIWTTRVAQHRKAADGTEKLLLELHDAERIECVLLRDDKQHCTVCISTQVGCAMGCAFCATGFDGAVRNLTTGEILEQVLQLQRLLKPKIDDLVGTGKTQGQRASLVNARLGVKSLRIRQFYLSPS